MSPRTVCFAMAGLYGIFAGNAIALLDLPVWPSVIISGLVGGCITLYFEVAYPGNQWTKPNN